MLVTPQLLSLLELRKGSILTTEVPRTMVTPSWQGLLELGRDISSIPGKCLHRRDSVFRNYTLTPPPHQITIVSPRLGLPGYVN